MSEQGYAERMRHNLKGLLAPVRKEYDDLGAREAELTAELEAVREARRTALGVLRRIDPDTYANSTPGRKKGSGTKAHGIGPNGSRTYPKAEEDTAHVRAWIDANADKLPAEFTSQALIDVMRSNGEASLGKDKIRHSAGLLHDRGYLTLVRLGNGGAKVYALTSGVRSE